MSTYKHLIVWQKAILLAKNIYTLSRTLPKEETFALASQMQRAAVSIASNIAEGNGRASRNEYRGIRARSVTLAMHIGPGDAGEPVITIMQPDES